MSSNTRLSLAYRDLEEVPSALFAKQASTLKELDLSNNRLTEVTFLRGLSGLETLVLDGNRITHQVRFPPLGRLHTLWLNHNAIVLLPTILDRLAEAVPRLRFLSMLGNPACPNYLNGGTLKQYKDYRLYVLSRLRHLEMLDDAPVTEDERQEAARIYGNLDLSGAEAAYKRQVAQEGGAPGGVDPKEEKEEDMYGVGVPEGNGLASEQKERAAKQAEGQRRRKDRTARSEEKNKKRAGAPKSKAPAKPAGTGQLVRGEVASPNATGVTKPALSPSRGGASDAPLSTVQPATLHDELKVVVKPPATAPSTNEEALHAYVIDELPDPHHVDVPPPPGALGLLDDDDEEESDWTDEEEALDLDLPEFSSSSESDGGREE